MSKHTTTSRPSRWRITLALDVNDLYGPEVDEALGGKEPMVDQWESGELIPTPEQIEKLAELTGMLPDWFYRHDEDFTGHGYLCRRTGRGRRCERIEFGPDADVVPLHKETLW